MTSSRSPEYKRANLPCEVNRSVSEEGVVWWMEPRCLVLLDRPEVSYHFIHLGLISQPSLNLNLFPLENNNDTYFLGLFGITIVQ